MTDEQIYVKITGGLGNQLFGLAAGLEQANRLGCGLVLLTNNYRPGGTRKFSLDQLHLPSHVSVLNESKRPRFFARRKTFREKGFSYDPSVFSVRPGMVMEGYFQSPKYFPNTKDLLRELVFPQDWVSESLDESIVPFTAVHVRRGDYLEAKTRAFHGVVGPSYFRNSLELLGRLNGFNRTIVFTDSPSHVRDEISLFGQGAELFSPDTEVDELETIRVMGRASRIVISNSSFSWWAAWKISCDAPLDGSIRVACPRPWFASGESAADLLAPNWVSFGWDD
jgi:hypothetical protein